MTNNRSSAVTGTPHRRRMDGYRPLAQQAARTGPNTTGINLKDPAAGGPANDPTSGIALPTEGMKLPSGQSANPAPTKSSIQEVQGALTAPTMHPEPASTSNKKRMAGYRPMAQSRQKATTAQLLSLSNSPDSVQAASPLRSALHSPAPPSATAQAQAQIVQATPSPAGKKQRMVGYRSMAQNKQASGVMPTSPPLSSLPDVGNALLMAEMPIPVHQQPSSQSLRVTASPAMAQTPRRRIKATPAPMQSGTQQTNAVTDTPTKSREGLPAQTPPAKVGIPGLPGASSTKTPVSSFVSTAGVGVKKRPAWFKPVMATAAILVLAVAVVFCARWLRTLEPVQGFIATYTGHTSLPDSAPTGLPSWLGWQHFLNIFFMVLIVRTGLQVRSERKPPGYWTAKENSFFSPRGNTPKKVSLTQWLHQSLDVLWVLNGLVFVTLLFATGQWMRIVPTGWDIFPNIVSTSIQYASLDWPLENGWIHYNALQLISYFITVFIAAPLAIISGIRFSTWWPEKAKALSKVYPVKWARSIHVPVMVYFIGFTIVHVFLVFFTGALRNLNHMYGSRDVVNLWGLGIFLASILVIAGACLLARPIFTTPVAARMGKISK